MVQRSTQLWIAAPYVTETDELLRAAQTGKSVRLLVGLNSSTSPDSLSKIHRIPNCEIRYFTRRFHAKIYLFDGESMLGSSNLTDGGLRSNREATICIDDPDDLNELRALFNELWESALVLTTEKLKSFAEKYKTLPRTADPNPWIEDAVGKAEPTNINVASAKRSQEAIFLEALRRQVHGYRVAFTEVADVLDENHLRRTDLSDADIPTETNRFLNWVRLTHAPGEESWQSTPLRSEGDRRNEILRLGSEWRQTQDHKISHEFMDWLQVVRSVFGTADSIRDATQDTLSDGLTSIHAFNEQLRFVSGGRASLPKFFWNANAQDVDKAKRTLTYLIYGSGEFIQRLHDVLYDPSMKLRYFGIFCALELYGTIKPNDCPPINGRMAKALRFIGFNVRGT